jgi:pilus assembly protein TadC
MAGGTKYKSTNTKITRDLPRFQEDMEMCQEGFLRASYFIQIIPKSLHGIYVVPISFL